MTLIKDEHTGKWHLCAKRLVSNTAQYQVSRCWNGRALTFKSLLS